MYWGPCGGFCWVLFAFWKVALLCLVYAIFSTSGTVMFINNIDIVSFQKKKSSMVIGNLIENLIIIFYLH